jgi:predicted dehydrogenase
MNKLRWGILSTAQIGRKNWKAIHSSGNSIVTAVASRDIERGRQFIKACQGEGPFETLPAALGSYEELLASKDVDAVYIPLPTGLRKEWVLRAAAAGKHILCEKPCGFSAVDVREMVEACRQNRVQFMDGVMFMHNPRLSRIRAVLDDGTSVGEVKRIMSIFSFAGGEDFFGSNIRIHSELEPAGCLGDLGWYCIRFVLWTLNWKLPDEVTGRILSRRGANGSPSSVPVEFSAELVFDGGASAGFYCAFTVPNQQWMNVSGAKGCLFVPDFVHVVNGHEHEPSFDVNQTRVQVKCCDCAGQHSDSRVSSQETHMIRNFADQVRSGKLNSDWPEFALKTQRVMDACLESARADGRAVAP